MANEKVHGNFKLEIDPSGLSAELVFSPQGEKDWTEGDVLALFTEKGINSPNKALVSELYREASGLKEEKRILAVEGRAAEPPENEYIEWNDIAVPENLAEEAQKTLTLASDPLIVSVKTVKKQIRKKVLKKPKLPFMPAKEEIETVAVKEEIEEAVDIDPTVEQTGWAETGAVLCTVSVPKPGKPGVDIYGQPIMPVPAKASMLPGKGVTKEKNQFIAQTSGFVRIGAGWVDIVAYRLHEWSVRVSQDKATCFLNFTPGNRFALKPDCGAILAEAAKLEINTETLISETKLTEIINEAIASETPFSDRPISNAEDGEFSIEFNPTNTVATLNLRKGRGHGRPLKLKEVGTAIQGSGIKGMQLAKIREDILAFRNGQDMQLEGYILAEGTEPQPPEPRVLELKTPMLPDDEWKPVYQRLQDGENEGIAPPPESGIEFPLTLTGSGALVKKEQELAAIPAAKPGKPGKDVFGNVLPPEQPGEPDIRVLENIRRQKDTFFAAIDGVFEFGEKEGTVFLRIRPFRDCRIQIEVSPDRMQALLSLSEGDGAGQRLSREAVDTMIESKLITHGIRGEVIDASLKQAQRGQAVSRVLFAEGEAPRHGGANKIQFRIPLASGSGVTIRKNGSADFKNQDKITNVQQNTLIAEILPPEMQGRDGFDITGQTLSAQEGKPFELDFDESIRRETEEDGTQKLYADASGELLYDGKRMSIHSSHVIKGDVNLETGNIRFPGAVQITGNVDTGFFIFSGQDIEVGENVYASLLSADGSIRIAQGVRGKGKGVLRAKKEIIAGFIEQSTLLAVGNCTIKNAILHSRVKCNGRVILVSDKGNFVGGQCKSRDGLEVQNLGSPKGVRTEISFGQNYLIQDQIEHEDREIDKLRAQIAKVDVQMRQYEKAGNENALKRIRQEKIKLIKLVERHSIRAFTLRERFEEHFESDIIVRGTAYPGVIVESHGRYHEITSPKSKIRIIFNQEIGHVEEQPLKT